MSRQEGRFGAGLCYGYDVVTTSDAGIEPVRGERRINAVEADVVHRAFREFASGASPRTIARRLNAENIPCPLGKLWTDSTVRGQVKRGTGPPGPMKNGTRAIAFCEDPDG